MAMSIATDFRVFVVCQIRRRNNGEREGRIIPASQSIIMSQYRYRPGVYRRHLQDP
jgi:hypothetical protein